MTYAPNAITRVISWMSTEPLWPALRIARQFRRRVNARRTMEEMDKKKCQLNLRGKRMIDLLGLW